MRLGDGSSGSLRASGAIRDVCCEAGGMGKEHCGTGSALGHLEAGVKGRTEERREKFLKSMSVFGN